MGIIESCIYIKIIKNDLYWFLLKPQKRIETS